MMVNASRNLLKMEKILNNAHVFVYVSTQESSNFDISFDVFKAFFDSLRDLKRSLNLSYIYYLYDSYNLINISPFIDDFNFIRSIYRNSDYDYLTLILSSVYNAPPEYKRTDRFIVSNYGYAKVWYLPLVNKTKDISYFANVDYTVLTNRNLRPAVYALGGKIIQTVTETDASSYSSIYFSPFIPLMGYSNESTRNVLTLFQREPNDYSTFPDANNYDIFQRKPFRYVIFYLSRPAELKFTLDCEGRDKVITPYLNFKEGLNLYDIGATVIPKYFKQINITEGGSSDLLFPIEINADDIYSRYYYYEFTDSKSIINNQNVTTTAASYTYGGGFLFREDVGAAAGIGVGTISHNFNNPAFPECWNLKNNWFPETISAFTGGVNMSFHHYFYTDGSNRISGTNTVVPRYYFFSWDGACCGSNCTHSQDKYTGTKILPEKQYFHYVPRNFDDVKNAGPNKLQLSAYSTYYQPFAAESSLLNSRDTGFEAKYKDCFAHNPVVFYLGQKNVNGRHTVNGTWSKLTSSGQPWFGLAGGGNGLKFDQTSPSITDLCSIQLNAVWPNGTRVPNNVEGGSLFRKRYLACWLENRAINFDPRTSAPNQNFYMDWFNQFWIFPFVTDEVMSGWTPIKKAFWQKYRKSIVLLNYDRNTVPSGTRKQNYFQIYRLYCLDATEKILSPIQSYFETSLIANGSVEYFQNNKIGSPLVPFPATPADAQYVTKWNNADYTANTLIIQTGIFKNDLYFYQSMQKRTLDKFNDSMRCVVVRFKNFSIFNNLNFSNLDTFKFFRPECADTSLQVIQNNWGFYQAFGNSKPTPFGEQTPISSTSGSHLNNITRGLLSRCKIRCILRLGKMLDTSVVNFDANTYYSDTSSGFYFNYEDGFDQKMVFGLDTFKRVSDNTPLDHVGNMLTTFSLYDTQIELTLPNNIKTCAFHSLQVNNANGDLIFDPRTQTDLVQPFELWNCVAKNQIELFFYSFGDLAARIYPNQYSYTHNLLRAVTTTEFFNSDLPNVNFSICGNKLIDLLNSQLLDWSRYVAAQSLTDETRRPIMIPLQMDVDLYQRNVETNNCNWRTPVVVTCGDKSRAFNESDYTNQFARGWLQWVKVLMVTTRYATASTPKDKDESGLEYPSSYIKGPKRFGCAPLKFTYYNPTTWPSLSEVFTFEHSAEEAYCVPRFGFETDIAQPMGVGNRREALIFFAVPLPSSTGLFYDVIVTNTLNQFENKLFRGLFYRMAIWVLNSRFDQYRNESPTLLNDELLKNPQPLTSLIAKNHGIFSQAFMDSADWSNTNIMGSYNSLTETDALARRAATFFDLYHTKLATDSLATILNNVPLFPFKIKDLVNLNLEKTYNLEFQDISPGTELVLQILNIDQAPYSNFSKYLETLGGYFTLTYQLINDRGEIVRNDVLEDVFIPSEPIIIRSLDEELLKHRSRFIITLKFDIAKYGFSDPATVNLWTKTLARDLYSYLTNAAGLKCIQITAYAPIFTTLYSSGFNVACNTSPTPFNQFSLGQEDLIGNLNTATNSPYPINVAEEFEKAHFILYPVKNKCTNFKNEVKYEIQDDGAGNQTRWDGTISTNEDGVKLAMRYVLEKNINSINDVGSFFGYTNENLQEVVVYMQNESFNIRRHYELSTPADISVYVQETIWEPFFPIVNTVLQCWRVIVNIPSNLLRLFKRWSVEVVYRSTLMKTCMIFTNAEFRLNQFLPIYYNNATDTHLFIQDYASNINSSFFILSQQNPNFFIKGLLFHLIN